jgi:ribose transport system permease protein
MAKSDLNKNKKRKSISFPVKDMKIKESLLNRLEIAFRKNTEDLSRIAVVALIFIVLTVLSPKFSDLTNLSNVIRVASLNLILATGIALTMLVTGIDLSIGSVIALSTMMFGRYFQDGRTVMEMVYGISGILLVSGFLGAINGFNIAYIGIPPFLATFAMSQVARGYSYYLAKGDVYSNFIGEFRFIGTGFLFGVPMPVVFALLVLIIIGLVLKKTTLGRKIYAIGSNREAAFYSGINVKATLMLTYMIAAIIAGFGGIVYLSRLNAAEANIGLDFAQNAIAAAAIGGISFRGGRGNIFGIIIGALLLSLVTNGMNLLRINSDWQMGLTGLIIIVGVLIDRSYSIKKAS